MALDVANDPYTWEHQKGWRQYRPLRPGRGMYHDVRRRLPYYWSDLRDALDYRIFPATVRMLFVNLLPALAFILDMSHNTGGFFGVNEALLSSVLAALVFSLFSVQPLTIVGITGLISLFNYTIYHIIQDYDVNLYPYFMVWVGIWAAVFHWITALFNWCDYMRCVTDFSSQTFALYVGTIYIIKGVEEIAVGFYDDQTLNGFASALVAILFTLTIYGLEHIGSTTFGNVWLRTILADYAYPIATIFWTGFTHFPGNISKVDWERLPVTRAFYPTTDRSWVIQFWNLDGKWICVAIPFGMLMTLLFYYDHNVSSLTAQARSFPLKKPAGFHWDFFLLGITCFVAGILNIPLPNGLVPQAPVHTDALTDYEDRVKRIETVDGTTLVRKETVAKRVVEQRVSHFIMGLALLGTMTGPLLVVLHTMPRAIFSGVFFVVGWGSIENNRIVQKILFLLRERRYQQPHDPLLQVPRRQILHYVSWQLLGYGCTVAISQTIAAIGFPVLITALIPLRWLVLPKLFTRQELLIMDDLTADNEVVLISLGGKPEMPERVMERRRKGLKSRSQSPSLVKSHSQGGPSDSSQDPEMGKSHEKEDQTHERRITEGKTRSRSPLSQARLRRGRLSTAKNKTNAVGGLEDETAVQNLILHRLEYMMSTIVRFDGNDPGAPATDLMANNHQQVETTEDDK